MYWRLEFRLLPFFKPRQWEPRASTQRFRSSKAGTRRCTAKDVDVAGRCQGRFLSVCLFFCSLSPCLLSLWPLGATTSLQRVCRDRLVRVGDHAAASAGVPERCAVNPGERCRVGGCFGRGGLVVPWVPMDGSCRSSPCLKDNDCFSWRRFEMTLPVHVATSHTFPTCVKRTLEGDVARSKNDITERSCIHGV